MHHHFQAFCMRETLAALSSNVPYVLRHTAIGRPRPQHRLFESRHRSSRCFVQRTLPTTTAALTRGTLLRLSMIPRTQQRSLFRRRNAQPQALRGIAHVGVVAHGRAYGALARPERRRAGAQLGDTLDACCAEAQEVDVGELCIGGFGEVC